MAVPNRIRYQCCVRGDPARLDTTDYVELVLRAPDSDSAQWLGAHRSCLDRVFDVEVMVGD